MTRNLRILLAAATALAAFGALSAGAHAAEETFHCQVEPCTLTLNTDGAVGSSTAHHVFIVKNPFGGSGSLTCKQLTGDATTATKTTEEITTTGLVYDTCSINGSGVLNVRMNSCDYLFTSGENGTTGATVHVKCPGTKHIEIEEPTGCIFEITPQTLRGAHYHNIGTPGTSSTETTIEARISKALSGSEIAIEVAATGTGCTPAANVGDTLTGEYTTGNTVVTAEKDNANKEMVEGWWA